MDDRGAEHAFRQLQQHRAAPLHPILRGLDQRGGGWKAAAGCGRRSSRTAAAHPDRRASTRGCRACRCWKSPRPRLEHRLLVEPAPEQHPATDHRQRIHPEGADVVRQQRKPQGHRVRQIGLRDRAEQHQRQREAGTRTATARSWPARTRRSAPRRSRGRACRRPAGRMGFTQPG